MSKPKRVVRCQGDVHIKHEGNIIVVIGNSGIYVKCNDRDCKRWTKISLSFPGLKINLSEAGITQETLPPGYHIDIQPATTVVSGRSV